jgi:hypothetical protein
MRVRNAPASAVLDEEVAGAANQELEEWKEKYITLMDDSYPVGRHENWTVCQALFPHAQAAVEYRPTNVKALEAWASVLFKAAWYASEMGNMRQRRRWAGARFRGKGGHSRSLSTQTRSPASATLGRCWRARASIKRRKRCTGEL